jgi:transcriptional regulator with XRE-family HTH domain
MGKTYEELMAELSPDRRARVRARASELIAEEKSLRDLRQARQLTQQRMAKRLGVKQHSISRLEQPSLAAADVPPNKSTCFYDSTAKMVRDLKSSPVEPGEVRQARNPAVAQLTQAQQSNSYWLSVLGQVSSEPRYFDITRQSLANLKCRGRRRHSNGR